MPYRGRSTKKFFLIANSSAVIKKPVSHADTSSGRLPLSFIQCVRAYAQLSLRQRCDTSLYVKSRSYGLMLYKFLCLFKIMCLRRFTGPSFYFDQVYMCTLPLLYYLLIETAVKNVLFFFIIRKSIIPGRLTAAK